MVFTDRRDVVSIPPEEVARLGLKAREAIVNGRAAVAERLRLSPDRVVYLRQVHGADVGYVTGPFGQDPPPLDGACTDQAGLGLAVLVADCVPLLAADPEAGVIGVAHAGRMGTTAGVVGSLITAMTARGAAAARTVVLIGPSICGSCYEVSPEIRARTAAVAPEAMCTTRWGTPGVDLRAAITGQLHGLGVRDVRHDRRCTMETASLYSYRREGPTGDFAGYVWRPDRSSLTRSRNAV